jgi:hypothetical protein
MSRPILAHALIPGSPEGCETVSSSVVEQAACSGRLEMDVTFPEYA